MEKIIFLFILSIGFTSTCLHAQYDDLSFERAYDSSISSGKSGVAIAVTDANLDGLEDIVRFNDARTLQIFLQVPEGGFELWRSFPRLPFQQWNILGLPLNKDRLLDWVSAGNDSGVNYWMSDSSNQYTHFNDRRYLFFAQGSNALDIDDSGSLDIFMCSDLSENYTLFNEGGIPFDQISFLPNSHPDTFFRSGNYGSVWEDLNTDGKADLYISKCSIFANHPSDPRRINQLLISQPDGSYKEVGRTWNVADSAQSWASSFADVDNDGLTDLLVINHGEPSALYMNQGGTFQESESFENLDLRFNSVQVLSQDLNCDGFIDFVITGSRATVLMNDGTGNFSEQSHLLGIYEHSISSAQMGDFNQDGFMDIFATRHVLYNTPSDREDLILHNPFSFTGNNYIRFQIIDSSNYSMDGIQVKASLYSDLARQSRTLRIGESYGVCGSNILHFGIGKNSKIDSVVFHWPRGTAETYFPDNINTTYLYTKGHGIRSEMVADVNPKCFSQGDTLIINNLNPNGDHFTLFRDEEPLSMDGQVGVTEVGRYFWIFKDDQGAWMRTKPFQVTSDSKINTELNVQPVQSLCYGSTITLSPLDTADFIGWRNGTSIPEFEVESEGVYQALFRSCNDTTYSDSVRISYRPEVPLRVSNDTVGRGERAILRATGEDIHWYASLDAERELQRGSSVFVINNLESDTVLFAESRKIYEVDDVSLGPVISEDNSELPNPWFNAELEFSALSDCILKRITVRAVEAGERSFILRNFQGEELARKDFDLDSGAVHVLPLDWALAGGQDYILTTRASTNFQEFGVSGPQLFQVQQDKFEFPYSDGKFISIWGTNGGINQFYYYTNCEFEIPPDTCVSERQVVRGIVDVSLASPEEYLTESISVFPNPVRDEFFVHAPFNGTFSLEIYSSTGKLVFQRENYRSGTGILTRGWSAGVYGIRIASPSGKMLRQLLVVQ